jgi:hypothetical protein
MLGYEGLLLLVGAFAMVRIYIHDRYNKEAFRRMHMDREKGKRKRKRLR